MSEPYPANRLTDFWLDLHPPMKVSRDDFMDGPPYSMHRHGGTRAENDSVASLKQSQHFVLWLFGFHEANTFPPTFTTATSPDKFIRIIVNTAERTAERVPASVQRSRQNESDDVLSASCSCSSHHSKASLRASIRPPY